MPATNLDPSNLFIKSLFELLQEVASPTQWEAITDERKATLRHDLWSKFASYRSDFAMMLAEKVNSGPGIAASDGTDPQAKVVEIEKAFKKVPHSMKSHPLVNLS